MDLFNKIIHKLQTQDFCIFEVNRFRQSFIMEKLL